MWGCFEIKQATSHQIKHSYDDDKVWLLPRWQMILEKFETQARDVPSVVFEDSMVYLDVLLLNASILRC